MSLQNIVIGIVAVAALVLGVVGLGKSGSVDLGAVPVLNSPLEVEGIQTFFVRQALRTSTTTPCAIRTPSATTTLERFAVNFQVGSTTAKQIILAKGTAMQASTTVLGSNLLAANAQGAFYATTTTLGDNVIAPNTWLNLSMVGGSGIDSPTGVCSATFRTI